MVKHKPGPHPDKRGKQNQIGKITEVPYRTSQVADKEQLQEKRQKTEE